MKAIVYTRPDGGVSVVHPAPGAQLADETEAEFVARVMAKDVPSDAINPRIVERAEVPSDRTFREAWALNGRGGPVVDMPKARAIHLDRIRKVRDAELTKLDIETVKAVGRGDDAERDKVEAVKQQLRDLPATIAPAIEAAATPEALVAIQPEIDAKEPRGVRG